MKVFKVGQTIAKLSDNRIEIMGEVQKVDDKQVVIDIIIHPHQKWLGQPFSLHIAHAQYRYTIISEPK